MAFANAAFAYAKKTVDQAITSGTDISWETVVAGGITFLTPLFTLQPGRLYELSSFLYISGVTGFTSFQWVDTANIPVGIFNANGIVETTTEIALDGGDCPAVALVNPTIVTQVKVRTISTTIGLSATAGSAGSGACHAIVRTL